MSIPKIEPISLDAALAMRHKKNPKEHDIPALIDSFMRFGFKAFPTIDEATKVMVSGHGRCLALQKMREDGYPPPEGIEIDGSDWRVPIVRGVSFRSEKERDAFVLADNQHVMRGGYNLDLMSEFMAGVADSDSGFKGLGFDDVELQSFGFSMESIVPSDQEQRFDGVGLPEERDEAKKEQGGAPAASGTMVREIDAGDLPSEKATITKLGDVWLLGEHVLVCGDSTTDGIARAMTRASGPVGMIWTDPPWNVAYGENPVSSRRERKGAAKTIMNDDLGKDFGEFCRKFVAAFTAVAPEGIAVYLAMSMQEYALIDATLKEAGWHWSSTIIWGKDALVLGRKDYHSQYEPLWYGWRSGQARRNPLRDRAQSDLWLIDRPRKSEQHPTMKPIRLVARSIENSTTYNDLVLDPFGGSGTTLLAAEQVGRRAALVELDPRYCDVIVERYEQLTGQKARRG